VYQIQIPVLKSLSQRAGLSRNFAVASFYVNPAAVVIAAGFYAFLKMPVSATRPKTSETQKAEKKITLKAG